MTWNEFCIPILMQSIPIPPHSHFQVYVLFPFPWDSRWVIPISIPAAHSKMIVLMQTVDSQATENSSTENETSIVEK